MHALCACPLSLSFCEQLRASVSPSRLAQFTMQTSTQGPHFGIGLLGPSASHGTAEPDDEAAFGSWGTGEEAWRRLCLSAPALCDAANDRHVR